MYDKMRNFFQLESASGILLVIATLFALLLANTSLRGYYHALLNVPFSIEVAQFALRKTLLHWVNDGMMALFFLLVGLEIKRELIAGALSSKAQALLPVVAAVGGMLVPALFYCSINRADSVALQGWAIPVATDIAFPLGVLALLGKRIPSSLKTFLLALAIIDDLGVVIIIALFYTQHLQLSPFIIAAGAIGVFIYLNRRNVSALLLYLAVGFVLWLSILQSGIHATLAGVITAFFVPLTAQRKNQLFRPLEKLEYWLQPWVAYWILPLFAFANAGVDLQGVTLSHLVAALPAGIALALYCGKPLGVFGFSWAAVRLGVAQLPEKASYQSLFGISILCGIGFTMSLFIATLGFENAPSCYVVYARLGILLGSTIAAITGYGVLHRIFPKNGDKV